MSEYAMHGWEAVAHFLDREGAPFELVEHAATFSATDEASAAGADPESMAKTVLLRDRDEYRLAIIPASQRLDLRRTRQALGASRHLRLATEAEMNEAFAVFEAGALPPFSALLALPEVLDRRLLEHDKVTCSAGDHRHSLVVSPRAIQRFGEPLIADVCREPTRLDA